MEKMIKGNSLLDSQYQNKNSHILWIDIAKVLTMILVIIGHSTYYRIITDYGFIDKMPPEETHVFSYKILSILTKFIYSFHMPFFMAVSGMTMAISINRYSSSSIFLSKKVRRLMVPFLTVTIFLSIPMKYISGYWNNSQNMVSDIFFGQFLLMGNSHLWFVVSLFIISIIFFFLHKHHLDKGYVYWTIVILISFLGKYIHIFAIGSAMKYYIFFALGFSLFENVRDIDTSLSKVIILWSALAVALALQHTIIKSLIPIAIHLTYYPIAILGCLNMVYTAKLISKIPFIENNKVFLSLNKNSYALYLYSDPFNYLLIFFSLYGWVMGTPLIRY